MKSITVQFAEFISRTQFDDLPGNVVNTAKQSILDLLGVAIGGFPMPFPQIVVNYLSNLGGKKEATLLFRGKRIKIPAVHAAFGNGVCGHALDMDNGCRYGGGHMGATVIPAAIAGSEVSGADGRALILGTVMGFEIQGRIGNSVLPSHIKRGFHQTGTMGTFGAAAAVSKIYGLDVKKTAMALGFAGLQSAGLLEVLHDGSMAKPLHVGKAASAGILSAEFAKNGAESPASVLEGRKGFYKAMSDAVNMDHLFTDLGEKYFIHKTYVKIHASCRHTHPGIDAILRLQKEKGIKFQDIANINILTYNLAESFVGTNTLPNTVEGAKFNLPLSASLAAYYGDAKMSRFCMDTIRNERIREMASHITVKAVDRWEKLYPHQRGVTVELFTKNGEQFTAEVPLAKGEPENPVSEEDLIDKFRDNASYMKKDSAEKIIDIIVNLERHKVSDLTRWLVM
jgi:2-methylcitrate dehydratase PrpD